MSTERIILGNNCIFSGNPRETGLNRNVLVVGGTGCGKTVSIVEPALMEALRVTKPNNKIVILTKRDMANKYIPLYKSAGFRVYDLDFSNPENGNCCYVAVRLRHDIVQHALQRLPVFQGAAGQGVSVQPCVRDAVGHAVLVAEQVQLLIIIRLSVFSNC